MQQQQGDRANETKAPNGSRTPAGKKTPAEVATGSKPGQPKKGKPRSNPGNRKGKQQHKKGGKRRKTARATMSPSQCVEKTMEVLVELCSLFGYKPKGPEEHKSYAQPWIRHVESGVDWIKVAKYKLAAFVARMLMPGHPELVPPSPLKLDDKPNRLVGGRLGRWLSLVLGKTPAKGWNREKQLELLQSLKLVKKGAPRPNEQTVKEKTAAFAAFMTEEYKAGDRAQFVFQKPDGKNVLSWADMSEYCESLGRTYVNPAKPGRAYKVPEPELELDREAVMRQLRRTVDEIFEKAGPYTGRDAERLFFPSTSANYLRNRRNAGAVGELLDDPDILEGLRTPGGWLPKESDGTLQVSDELQQEFWPQPQGTPEGWVRGDAGELEPDISEAQMYAHKGPLTEGIEDELSQNFAELMQRIHVRAVGSRNLATPVGLAEAFKVRIITKSDPYRMTVLRPVWKKVHNILRHQRAFQLIGEPVTEELINKVFGRTLGPGMLFFSGDYEAATDNLHSWVSETIGQAIAEKLQLGPETTRLLIDSLTRHEIEQPNGEFKTQRRGQLMGSITSFPILCIANAAVTRWAYEVGQQRGKLRLNAIPMLINGDDVAAKLSLLGYKVWRNIAHFCGLKESVGKTYISREFVDINSTSFMFKENSTYPEPAFRRIKQVNLGLAYGLKRSSADQGNDERAPIGDLGSLYRELIESAPGELRKPLHFLFLEKNKAAMEAARPIPWHVPEWLGGLGLTGVVEPSKLDRQIARMIVLNWKSRKPRRVNEHEKEWMTWNIAEKRMPTAYPCANRNFPGVTEYDRLASLACLDLLFDQNVELKQLKTTVTAQAGQALRHNQKLWTPATYKKISGEAMSLEEMNFRPTYSSIVPPPPGDQPINAKQIANQAAAQTSTAVNDTAELPNDTLAVSEQ